MFLCLLRQELQSCFGTTLLPKFSWDRVPVFIHMCNKTGPFNLSTAQHIARFPMVTIEKGQGDNSTIYPYNESYTEIKILDACQQIKSINSSIICIFYYNSGLDWEMYQLHEKMLQHKGYWLRDSNNVTVYLKGSHTFPQPPNGMDCFDFTQIKVQNFFINECINLTNMYPNIIDGCFVDRATYNTFNGYNFTQQLLNSYINGHNNVSINLQLLLSQNNKSVAITNGFVSFYNNISNQTLHSTATQIEQFQANKGYIEKLMSYAKNNILTQAHAGYYQDGTDNYCNDINNSLSAFLIGAGKYHYYGCSQGWYIEPDWIKWHYQYSLPLGEPLSNATLINNTLYTRTFAAGTVVTFNTSSNTGNIKWGTWEQLKKYKRMKRKKNESSSVNRK